MNRFFSRPSLALALAILGVMSLAAPASAGDRPFVSRGTAQFVNANDFVGSGKATRLGQYTEEGSAQFTPTANPAVFRVDAWSVYTAANGDQLYAVFTGDLNGSTGALTARVRYMGGTGRFDDARGCARLTGQMLPDGTITVAVNGAIDY